MLQSCFFFVIDEGQDDSNGLAEGAGVDQVSQMPTPTSMRMVTRLRNPDSKLSQQRSQQGSTSQDNGRDSKEVGRLAALLFLMCCVILQCGNMVYHVGLAGNMVYHVGLAGIHSYIHL